MELKTSPRALASSRTSALGLTWCIAVSILLLAGTTATRILGAGGPQEAGVRNGVIATARPSLVIVGGRLHPVSGEPLDDGVVVVREGRIAEVGPRSSTSIPTDIPRIDAGGKTVIPGLVLPASVALAADSAEVVASEPYLQMADVFDPFHPLVPVLQREGITTVGLLPVPRDAVGGLGVAVKLVGTAPEGGVAGAAAKAIAGNRHLSINLAAPPPVAGSSSSSPAERLSQYIQLRRLLVNARNYRLQWKKYREAVKDYNEKVRAWQKARQKDAGETEKSGEETPPGGDREARDGDTPADAPTTRSPEEENGGKEKKPAEGEKSAEKAENGKDADKKTESPPRPKPPREPGVNEALEVLLRALDGELKVWVLAHRRDEIDNALRLGADFGLDLVLLGATEGYRRAESLQAAGVPVIAGPILVRERNVWTLNHRETNAAELARAGVSLSFADPEARGLASSHLRLHASVAVRGGLEPELALRAITLEAARILGVGERVGSIEPGKDADLVILDGPPLSAASRVERVLVDGRLVYSRAREF